jgi:uncharacterized protein YndB with AHSA1/START domain
MNGRIVTVADRPALRFERHLDHSVERVWRAITEPEELRRWSPAVPEWQLEPGARYTAEGGTEPKGQIQEVDPPRLLAYAWESDQFRFELAPVGDGCLLVFTHVFGDPGLSGQHAAGWEIYLGRLDVHLAGGYLSEEEAHASFAREVSLEDGPKLRLERRYDHPIERVWRAITDPDDLQHWFPGPAIEVTESDPPRLLAGSWYGDALRFDLRPDGDGCVLVFTHAFDDRAKAARDGAGWDRCFARFEALLEGEPMSEAESLKAWPEAHERYAERFGVDPALGREAFAQHSPE